MTTTTMFSLGQKVRHKAGIEGVVERVVTQIRQQDSGMVLELENPVYVIAYVATDGVLRFVETGEVMLEAC